MKELGGLEDELLYKEIASACIRRFKSFDEEKNAKHPSNKKRNWA